MLGDKELSNISHWTREITSREGVIETIDKYLYGETNIQDIFIGYKSSFSKKEIRFKLFEDDDILRKTLRYYKIQQCYRILELVGKIKELVPPYSPQIILF